MSSPIVPYIANILFSTRLLKLKRLLAERKRKRQNQPHLITVYLTINDPYSYLLLQILADLQKRFAIEYDFRTVLNRQSQMYPAPSLWDKNAHNDGGYLAKLYNLDFPATKNAASPQFDAQLTAQLLHWELQPGFLDNALSLFAAYWQGDNVKIKNLVDEKVTGHGECYDHHLCANEAKLKDSGHYLSAMLHYGGEWYWGLDRLQYLESRLNGLDLNRESKAVKFNLGHKDFCKQMSSADRSLATQQGLNKEPIEMYWSLRSPYSYLALIRTRQLAKHYQVDLVVKPVLPMVMRRMQVPNNKKSYISQDVKREALEYNIDYGLISDPLGKGVENCYAMYEYAQSKDKGLEYLEAYARGVWSQGIRSDTEKGLQVIVQSVGLNWLEAKQYLNDDSWRVWAQHNLAELYGHDLWGVPSFKYLDTLAFGQDRINLIETQIVRHFKGVDRQSQAVNSQAQ